MFNLLTKIFSQINTIKGMVPIDQVKLNVPSTAQYVTLVDMVVLSEQIQFSKPEYGIGGVSESVETDGVDADSMVSAYMLHDGRELMFIHDRQTIFSTPLENIATLESIASVRRRAGYYRSYSGFVCNLRDGRCILISTPMPVSKDETTNFKTIGRMTDSTGGWSKQLSPYGIQTIY